MYVNYSFVYLVYTKVLKQLNINIKTFVKENYAINQKHKNLQKEKLFIIRRKMRAMKNDTNVSPTATNCEMSFFSFFTNL